MSQAFTAATDAAEAEAGNRGCAAAAGGEPRERGVGPAFAARTEEGEGVVVLEQVGHGFEADRGGHGHEDGQGPGSADEPVIDGVGLQAY